MNRQTLNRRRLLQIGAAGAAGAAAVPLMASPAAAADLMPYAWAMGPTIPVSSGIWTSVKWTEMIVNETNATVDSNDEKWVFPSSGTADGLYSLMVEVAWENDHLLPAHRRIMRVVQPLGNLGDFAWATAEVNSAVTTGGQDDEIDQKQMVCMQPGEYGGGTLWIQVWQNSGSTIELRRVAPEAPSFMLAKLSDSYP